MRQPGSYISSPYAVNDRSALPDPGASLAGPRGGSTMTGTPGSHPHADRPNWQPADNVDDYFCNCHEGLEAYSERRVAKLLGVSRMNVTRMKLMADLPEALFERLLAMPSTSTNEFAAVAQALARGKVDQSAEHCPHCGGTLRIRASLRALTLKVVNDWLRGRAR
jgi:hypothetical protein